MQVPMSCGWIGGFGPGVFTTCRARRGGCFGFYAGSRDGRMAEVEEAGSSVIGVRDAEVGGR
jgi:hypothetical protein